MFIRSTGVLKTSGSLVPPFYQQSVPSYMKTAARLYAAQHQWKPGENYQTWRPGGIKEMKDTGPVKEPISPQAETREIIGKPSYSALGVPCPKGFEEGPAEHEAMVMAKGGRYDLFPGDIGNWKRWLSVGIQENTSTPTTVVVRGDKFYPDKFLAFLYLVERSFMHNEVWHAQNAVRYDVNEELKRVSALFQDVYGRILATEKGVAGVSKSVANLVDSPNFRRAIKEVIMGDDRQKGLIDDPEFRGKIKELIKEVV